MIKVVCKGDYKKADRLFSKFLKISDNGFLNKYGEKGVEALRSATPLDSGVTADSWSYNVEYGDGSAVIYWENSNTNDGVNIAVILQYGHGTGTGGYVAGRDYINPAIQPIFDEIADAAWREVTSI